MVRKLILAGILASGLLMAQRGGGGGAGSSGMSNLPMRHRPAPGKADQIADKLKLNSKQKDQLLDILNAARQQAAPVHEEMDKQRADIASALIDGKPKEEVQKLVDGYAAVAGRMATWRAMLSPKYAPCSNPISSPSPRRLSRSWREFRLGAGALEEDTDVSTVMPDCRRPWRRWPPARRRSAAAAATTMRTLPGTTGRSRTQPAGSGGRLSEALAGAEKELQGHHGRRPERSGAAARAIDPEPRGTGGGHRGRQRRRCDRPGHQEVTRTWKRAWPPSK